MSADQDDCGRDAPAPPDPAASLAALSWCLRALACGYGLLPAERTACLTLLQGKIPGMDTPTLAVVTKLLQVQRRLTARQRDKAAELSVRLAGQVTGLRKPNR